MPAHAAGSADGGSNVGQGSARERTMTILKCYQVLGLAPGATLRQIHRAYKKLVLQHHPDRNSGDPASLKVFVEATEAYAQLKRAYALREAGKGFGVCPKCERLAPLLQGIGGRAYCSECLLARRRKFLPLPTYEQIRCVGVISLEGAALYLLVHSIVARSVPHGLVAFALGILAFCVMAYDFWTADVIER
ncbi:MAG: hypothetical protein DCC65_02995 [Planctomycetota bacterium]|nr:MAG: hypothetical protein DCC65_02995 [Planctomycetota bacterium]